jgi:predicted DNA-binding protein (MmcQ/YjbR family)
MNIEEAHAYCLSKKAVEETFPFDEVTLVFKVKGKMFALIPLDNLEKQISLKCDPERAIALREEHSAIVGAYHFNKKHWNTVLLDNSLPDALVCELIDHSYNLVVAGLTKKLRDELQAE